MTNPYRVDHVDENFDPTSSVWHVCGNGVSRLEDRPAAWREESTTHELQGDGYSLLPPECDCD